MDYVALLIAIFSLLTIGFLAMCLVAARRRLSMASLQMKSAADRVHLADARALAERSTREFAEQALSQHESRTRAILEAAADGIITISDTGIIQSFNRAAERIFQYGAAEVVGRNVSMLMPEPYHSAHDYYLHNYLQTNEARIIGIGREVMGQRKNGKTFPMDLAVGEGRLDGKRIFAGTVRDITERKETEERLHQTEEKFRLLVDGVRDYAIALLDCEGNISSWNQGAERMNGWTADEAVGRNISLFFTAKDNVAGEPERIMALVRRDGNFDGEALRRRKDNSTYWAHVTMTPLFDDRGTKRGYVHIARDMTAQHVAEDALRRAKEDAERANMAKSKFLAAASHDLRQPVQALMFFTSALSLKIKDTPSASMLDDLQQSLEGLNVLLESLLDVSRLDAGVVAPHVENIPIAPLLERIANEYAMAARGKGIGLTVMPSRAFVRSDPTLLGRIISNLVANAVRYTPKGRILVGVRQSGANLRLEVWDSGIGIPADRTEEIFQEFTQLGNPERDRSQGLGLGLAIVRRLARLLDHPLVVRSEPGRGSTFSVEIPQAPAQVMALPQPAVALESGGRRLVMIIDDEAPVLKGLGMILEEWGYEVLAAGSEDEAIELLENRRQQPHAILADYRLRNGRTGAEAVRHIRALFNAPIPCIIITGDTAPERLREAEASGFSILHKPVQPPHLHSLLAQSLSSWLH
jgi:PAS domain S-box-containing protein